MHILKYTLCLVDAGWQPLQSGDPAELRAELHRGRGNHHRDREGRQNTKLVK